MEIYSLKDENTDKKSMESGDAASELVITGLKQGVKNPNRVNVFVNAKFAFSLDVAQVVDYKLKVGVKLSVDKYVELKNASEFGKLYQRALEWVLVRPRAVREVRDYLRRKLKNTLRGPSATNEERASEVPPVTTGRDERVREEYFEFSEEIIQRLISRGYLDDRKFAEWYVENRFVKKGISQKKLRVELMKKGISRDIIDEVLNSRNDEEEIDKIIAKKRGKYTDEKLIQYLCRQGFPYELVKEKIHYSEMD